MSHLPFRSVIGAPACGGRRLPSGGSGSGCCRGGSRRAAAAVFATRLPVKGNSPKSPTFTLPVDRVAVNLAGDAELEVHALDG